MNLLLALIYSLFSFLKKTEEATVDLGVVLVIGIAFAGLTVLGFIIWTIRKALMDNWTVGAYSSTEDNWTYAFGNSTLSNVTTGFDSAVTLIIVAITIFILAIAISALLLLRQK